MYGLDPTEEGWKVEVQDCGDFGGGLLSSVTLVFEDIDSEGKSVAIRRESGTISLPLNDGSCAITSFTLPDSDYIGSPSSNGSSLSVSCNGACDQELVVVPTGGNAPYIYQWNDPSLSGKDSVLLCGGANYLTVIDANNCSIKDTLLVDEPNIIAVTFDAKQLTCFGSASASVKATISGGFAPYSYSWSNGVTGADSIIGLSQAWYFLTVTDSKSCSTIDSILISEPTQIVVNKLESTPTGCSASTGTALVEVSGGIEPYNYSWSNGASGSSISGLPVGIYNVTISDANLCLIDTLIAVEDTSSMYSYITSTDTSVSCIGATDANAKVTVVNGLAPYEYKWSNNETSAQISNLAAGIYTVTVTDDNLCSSVSLVTITTDSVLAVDVEIVPISCFGSADAQILLHPKNGTPNYTALWADGSSSLALASLDTGVYAFEITDAAGCIISDSVEITQPIEAKLQ
ncbi:MAG: SprB repeat-containing protein [Bacteroidales bacterium]|nr:SprB repeat-containing protein [Bacteroidales bacterium]